jgi:hypothetical protein
MNHMPHIHVSLKTHRGIPSLAFFAPAPLSAAATFATVTHYVCKVGLYVDDVINSIYMCGWGCVMRFCVKDTTPTVTRLFLHTRFFWMDVQNTTKQHAMRDN